MVTAEELREKPVLLELTVGGRTDKLSWLIMPGKRDHSKLEIMSAKDVVDHMLSDYYIVSVNASLASEIREYVEKECKGCYSISTATGNTLVCKTGVDGTVIEDQRTRPVLEILITAPATFEQEKIDVWYQKMKLIKPKFI